MKGNWSYHYTYPVAIAIGCAIAVGLALFAVALIRALAVDPDLVRPSADQAEQSAARPVGPGEFGPDLAWPYYPFRQGRADLELARDNVGQNNAAIWRRPARWFFGGLGWWLVFPIPVVAIFLLLIATAVSWLCFLVYALVLLVITGAQPAGARSRRDRAQGGRALAAVAAAHPDGVHALLPRDPVAGLPVPHLPSRAPRRPAGPSRPAVPPLRVRHPPAHAGLARSVAHHPGLPAVRGGAAVRGGRGQGYADPGVRRRLGRQDPLPVRLARQSHGDRGAGGPRRDLSRPGVAGAGGVRSGRDQVRAADRQDLDQRAGVAHRPAGRWPPVRGLAPVRRGGRALPHRAAAGRAALPRRRPRARVRARPVLRRGRGQATRRRRRSLGAPGACRRGRS